MAIFWKPGNSVNGNATNDTCKGTDGWMDLTSLDYSMNINNSKAGTSGGFSKDGIHAAPIMITKLSDAGSMQLQQQCCQGMNFAEMEFKELQKTEKEDFVALHIKLKNVHIADFNLSTAEGSGQPNETYSLVYEAIEVHLADQSQAGSKAGKSQYSWNMSTDTDKY